MIMEIEDAKKQLAELNEKPQGDWFCPLINDKCNPACVCFQGNYIGADPIRIMNAYCGNTMFFRECNL
jgi:hypothetical protein